MATWIYAGGLTSTDFSDGETTEGWAPQTYIYGGHVVIAESGNALQMSVKARNDSSTTTRNIKFGLYTSAGSLVAQSTATCSSITQAWVDSGAFSAAVSAGTYYVMVSSDTAASEFVVYGFDTTGSGTYATEAYATAMAASETLNTQAEANQLYGVRLSFEAGASQSNAPRTVHQMKLMGAM